MMDWLNNDARIFLEEFQLQSEEVREVFIYAACQSMVQTGLLQFLGVFNNAEYGPMLLYKNSDTGDVFEITKPELSDEEDSAIRAHIGELLREAARAA